MKKKLLTACLISTALLVGCREVEEADLEACEHLQEGPSSMLTASATSTGAPAVSNDHRRYDIALVDVQGGKGGSVSFAAAAAGHYILFTSADVPVVVTSSGGQTVAAEQSAKNSPECTEVKGRHMVPLQVGTYTLTFGPTSQANLSLVVEEMVHEGH